MAKKTFPIVAIQINKKRETEVSRRLINFVLLMYKQLTQAQRYTISTMRQNDSYQISQNFVITIKMRNLAQNLLLQAFCGGFIVHTDER